MAIYLTNIASMQAQRHLANNMNLLNTTMRRLSSGLRINSAKDDPAGLLISNRLTTEINGLYQANRNSSDGIALAQTAEGAMDEITNMLQRMRTLAVQSSNGTLTSEDREALQKEANSLSEEITRIAEQTSFGGAKILLGENSELGTDGIVSIQVGAYSGNSINIDLSQSMRLEDLWNSTNIANGDDYDADTDSILSADGKIQISTVENAQKAIAGIDSLLSVVNSSRSSLGATMNRLDSVIRVNSNARANIADARSRILDTDYAEESANLMRLQIMQQASVSMMMQANSRPNLILQLLQGI